MKILLVSTSLVLNVFAVTVKGEDRETYLIPRFFPDRETAEHFAQTVKRKGEITPERWTPITKKGKPLSVKPLFAKVHTLT